MASGDIVVRKAISSTATLCAHCLRAARLKPTVSAAEPPSQWRGWLWDEDGEDSAEGDGDELQPAVVERPVHGAPQAALMGIALPKSSIASLSLRTSKIFDPRPRDRFRPHFEQNSEQPKMSRDRDRDARPNRQEEAPARPAPAPAEAAQPAEGGNWKPRLF